MTDAEGAEVVTSPPWTIRPARLPSRIVYGSPVRQKTFPENCHPSVTHFNAPVLWNEGLTTKSPLNKWRMS